MTWGRRFEIENNSVSINFIIKFSFGFSCLQCLVSSGFPILPWLCLFLSSCAVYLACSHMFWCIWLLLLFFCFYPGLLAKGCLINLPYLLTNLNTGLFFPFLDNAATLGKDLVCASLVSNFYLSTCHSLVVDLTFLYQLVNLKQLKNNFY